MKKNFENISEKMRKEMYRIYENGLTNLFWQRS